MNQLGIQQRITKPEAITVEFWRDGSFGLGNEQELIDFIPDKVRLPSPVPPGLFDAQFKGNRRWAFRTTAASSPRDGLPALQSATESDASNDIRGRELIAEVTAILSSISRGRLDDARRRAARAAARYPGVDRLSRLLFDLSHDVSRSTDSQPKSWVLEMNWIRSNRRDFSGQWVAIKGDELIATASSLKELRRQLDSNNFTEVLLQKIS